MTVDKAIAALQEAKEHGIQGGRKIILHDTHDGYETDIFDIVYDNKTVIINF